MRPYVGIPHVHFQIKTKIQEEGAKMLTGL